MVNSVKNKKNLCGVFINFQHLALLLLVVLVASIPLTVASAQTTADIPKTINYQGNLSDFTGEPVNETLKMTFRLYNRPDGDNFLWEESFPRVVVSEGRFSVELGSIEELNLLFDEKYYLGIEIEDDSEMTPRKPLSSVAYAFQAARAVLAQNAERAINADTADIASRALTADVADAALQADQADVATNALNADEATLADLATRALNADNADLATRATTADQAAAAILAARALNADRAAASDLADVATNALNADQALSADVANDVANGSIQGSTDFDPAECADGEVYRKSPSGWECGSPEPVKLIKGANVYAANTPPPFSTYRGLDAELVLANIVLPEPGTPYLIRGKSRLLRSPVSGPGIIEDPAYYGCELIVDTARPSFNFASVSITWLSGGDEGGVVPPPPPVLQSISTRYELMPAAENPNSVFGGAYRTMNVEFDAIVEFDGVADLGLIARCVGIEDNQPLMLTHQNSSLHALPVSDVITLP